MIRTTNIIGILNVTPDSYHDGGRYLNPEAAMARVEEMIGQGADIIEVGGESTGPGSADVFVLEEMQRVIPVVMAIRMVYPQVVISVDTHKSQVAAEAIKSGASLINDVTAGRADPKMFSVVADAKASIVLMYAKDKTPRTTREERQYDDVVETVLDFLAERKAAAMSAGIHPSRIILDPGLGHFVSADAAYSFEILARLKEFLSLGCPLLLSPSRKSFIAGAENIPVAGRLPGTIAASAIAVLHGATYIRTHDVAEVRQGAGIAAAVLARSTS
ncbi:MAG: folP [Candidatus Peribacteria bacterium]|nr:folP [Candidatus Peribacteria bacterium]